MQPDLFDDPVDQTDASHPALGSTAALQTLLADWSDRHWLRALDAELPITLHGMVAEPNPLVWWLTAALSAQYSRGHSCIDLNDLLKDADGLLGLPTARDGAGPFSDRPSQLLQGVTLTDLTSALTASPWVESPDASPAPLILTGHRLYLRRLFQAELQVKAAIAQRLAAPVETPDTLGEQLDALFDADTDNNGQPNWQRLAVAAAVQQSFSIITGGPGTGKTTTVLKLLAVLQQCFGTEQRILLAAPTGKAAARLSDSIGNTLKTLADRVTTPVPKDVSTLHRLLGALPNRRRFRHHAHNPLLADVVVVDEASMIDLELMAALFEALPSHCRLILLGDRNQLASVEAGSVLSDLCTGADAGNYRPGTLQLLQPYTDISLSPWAEAEPGLGSDANQATVMLRRSYRFTDASGIGQLAMAVNAGTREATDCFAQFDDIAWLKVSDTDARSLRSLVVAGYEAYLRGVHTEPLADEVTTWAAGLIADYSNFQVLCALRQGDWGVQALNQRIEQWLEQAGLLDREGHQWYHGRPVMIQRNNYNLGLMNGDIGLCLRHPETGALRVVFPLPDGTLKWVRPSRLNDLDTVFAMTVHKSQGSEFGHCVLALPVQPNPILTRELLYTGITRAKHRFTLVAGDATVVQQAITKRVRRSSGL